jgi:V8-like Glu-specific endopeptidase
MKNRAFWVMASLLIATSTFAAGIDRAAAKSMERPTGGFDRQVHLAAMLALHEGVSEEAIALAASAPLVVEVSAAERKSVAEPSMERKMRVGVVRELAVPVLFDRARITTAATLHDAFGATEATLTGGFDWDGVIRSPEAAALRVHFTDFDLPEGAELYVYTNDGMAFGPYTGKGPNGTGEFWSNTVAGAEIILQLRAGSSGDPRFTIAGLGYLTEEFAMARALRPVTNAANTKPCSFNANCTIDAACGNENAAVNVATDAVAHILFASGAYLYICTGGLVADSDTGTNTPYFITANHCISKGSEAASMETFFFYRASTCQSCPDPGAANTTGSSLVVSGRTGDFTLLRLSQPAPNGAAFLGWSTTALANTNGAHLYRLSHPKGAPQAYSEHDVDTSRPTCRSWPRGSWIYSSDVLGATEGGSSGSPVVNGAGQLVGQLSGGCGYNVGDVCDTESNATVDGAFAAYYNSVAPYLGGGGGSTCTDNDGDGYCVSEGDCNDNNASVYPGANDTKGRPGRDGIDNDCDGTPDA